MNAYNNELVAILHKHAGECPGLQATLNAFYNEKQQQQNKKTVKTSSYRNNFYPDKDAEEEEKKG